MYKNNLFFLCILSNFFVSYIIYLFLKKSFKPNFLNKFKYLKIVFFINRAMNKIIY